MKNKPKVDLEEIITNNCYNYIFTAVNKVKAPGKEKDKMLLDVLVNLAANYLYTMTPEQLDVYFKNVIDCCKHVRSERGPVRPTTEQSSTVQ